MRKYIIILLCVLLSSCGAKKQTIRTDIRHNTEHSVEVRQTDTISINQKAREERTAERQREIQTLTEQTTTQIDTLGRATQITTTRTITKIVEREAEQEVKTDTTTTEQHTELTEVSNTEEQTEIRQELKEKKSGFVRLKSILVIAIGISLLLILGYLLKGRIKV